MFVSVDPCVAGPPSLVACDLAFNDDAEATRLPAYLYADARPTGRIDPSGLVSAAELGMTNGLSQNISRSNLGVDLLRRKKSTSGRDLAGISPLARCFLT
jgi:hypothetical protein